MKAFWGVFLFVAVGLAAAWIVGFQPVFFAEPLPADKEQKGLSERIIIKFNHVVAENTPKGLAAEHFAQLVKKRTNDRVEIQVFPNGILYSDKDEFGALMNGEIQMIAPAFSNLTAPIAQWSAMDLPFAFPNVAAVEEAFQGDIGRMLFQTLEPKGLMGLTYWSNGFKQMTSSKRPLISPEDFRNQRFRIIPSNVLETQFALLGAKTAPSPFNDVYKNLENGFVDGQENTTSNIFTKRLYQVQKYLTVSNHGYLGYAVIVNKKFWMGLPRDVQAELRAAMEETTAWMKELATSMNESQLNELKKIPGLQIHVLTPEERRTWIQSLDPMYDQYNSAIGAPLMEKIKELRAKYLDSGR